MRCIRKRPFASLQHADFFLQCLLEDTLLEVHGFISQTAAYDSNCSLIKFSQRQYYRCQKDWIVCKHSGRYIAFDDVLSIHQVVWKLFRFRLALNGYRTCRRAIGQKCQALTLRHFKYGSTAFNGRVKSNERAGEMMKPRA